MSTRAFAEKFWISSTVLNQLENEKVKNPSMNNLKAIAKVLEMPLEKVFQYYDMMLMKEMKAIPVRDKRLVLIEALTDYGLSSSCIKDVLDYIHLKIICNHEDAYTSFQRSYGKLTCPGRVQPISEK